LEIAMPTSLPIAFLAKGSAPTPTSNPMPLFIAAWAIALLLSGALENVGTRPDAMDQFLPVVDVEQLMPGSAQKY
jgi:hypothetical protein